MNTIKNSTALGLFFTIGLMISPSSQLFSIEKSKDHYISVLTASMWAGGVGDALGRVTEFIESTDLIFKRYPYGVRSYNDFLVDDWKYVPAELKDKKIAPYTDDTAMAKLVMKELICSRENNWDLNETMCHLAISFINDAQDTQLGWAALFRAPGNACKAGVKKLSMNFAAWDVQAHTAGGCGSVMRAHPFGLVFADNPKKASDWAVEHSRLTHGDPIALAACAAMATGVAYAVQGKDDKYIVEEMINAAARYDAITAHKMEIAYGLAQRAKELRKPHKDIFAAYKNAEFRKYNDNVFNTFLGWAAHDAIAATVYTFALSPDNVMEAIYLGVHTPGDSDSIASMAGALVGACVGSSALPQELIKQLENNQELKDDAIKAALLLV